MGSGDWSIETSIALADVNYGESFEITLMVGFDPYDQVWPPSGIALAGSGMWSGWHIAVNYSGAPTSNDEPIL